MIPTLIEVPRFGQAARRPAVPCSHPLLVGGPGLHPSSMRSLADVVSETSVIQAQESNQRLVPVSLYLPGCCRVRAPMTAELRCPDECGSSLIGLRLGGPADAPNPPPSPAPRGSDQLREPASGPRVRVRDRRVRAMGLSPQRGLAVSGGASVYYQSGGGSTRRPPLIDLY